MKCGKNYRELPAHGKLTNSTLQDKASHTQTHTHKNPVKRNKEKGTSLVALVLAGPLVRALWLIAAQWRTLRRSCPVGTSSPSRVSSEAKIPGTTTTNQLFHQAPHTACSSSFEPPTALFSSGSAHSARLTRLFSSAPHPSLSRVALCRSSQPSLRQPLHDPGAAFLRAGTRREIAPRFRRASIPLRKDRVHAVRWLWWSKMASLKGVCGGSWERGRMRALRRYGWRGGVRWRRYDAGESG